MFISDVAKYTGVLSLVMDMLVPLDDQMSPIKEDDLNVVRDILNNEPPPKTDSVIPTFNFFRIPVWLPCNSITVEIQKTSSVGNSTTFNKKALLPQIVTWYLLPVC